MATTLPAILETLRSATAQELHCVSFEGITATLSLDGIAELSPSLEAEWGNDANTVAFRALVLWLLARLTVYNSICGRPVHAEFWEGVSKSDRANDRRTAIMACNLSKDERLWNLLARTWRTDERGLNRALALEMLGTTVRGDAQRRVHVLGEYRAAIASDDALRSEGRRVGKE